LGEVQYKN